MFDDNNSTPEQQEIARLQQQTLALKAELYDSALNATAQKNELSRIYGTALSRAATVLNLQVDGKLPNSVDEFHAALTEFEEMDSEIELG
jgi:hypothetical protein